MGLSNETEKNGNAKWVCQCDCGNWIVIDGQRLRNGTTRSCGCLRREVTRHQSQTNQAFKAYQGNSDNLKNKDGIFYASLRKSSRNSSGVVGVSFDQHSQKYIARLRFNGRYVLNKAVDTLEEAAELRWMAEQQYFHQDVQN